MSSYFGMHNQFTAQPGQANALQEMLLAAADGLRGNQDCLLYLISRSPEDPNLVWVTEAWTDRTAHEASLQDEDVRAAVQRALPLIAAVSRTELRLVGGKGV